MSNPTPQQRARERAGEILKKNLAGLLRFQLRERVIDAMLEFATPEKEEDWISVDEDLPKERPGWSHSADVNILREDGVVSTGSYGWMNNLGWADYLYGNNTKPITHWMPLPKPLSTPSDKTKP